MPWTTADTSDTIDARCISQSQTGIQLGHHGKLKGHVETDEQWLHRQQQTWYYRCYGLRCALRLG